MKTFEEPQVATSRITDRGALRKNAQEAATPRTPCARKGRSRTGRPQRNRRRRSRRTRGRRRRRRRRRDNIPNEETKRTRRVARRDKQGTRARGKRGSTRQVNLKSPNGTQKEFPWEENSRSHAKTAPEKSEEEGEPKTQTSP